MTALPYENATSGRLAVDEMRKILLGFGASSFGVMEQFGEGIVVAQFLWRGRNVTIKASVNGYAAAWLRHHPWNSQRRANRVEHERRAQRQAQISVYSILRDWIKGQVTAIEVGLLSFDGAFLGQIMLPNGETVLERVQRSDMLALPHKPSGESSDERGR